MGKHSNKPQTVQLPTQSTSSYSFMNPPDTADIQKVRDHKFTVDPRVSQTFGAAREKLDNSYGSYTGAAMPASLREAAYRSDVRTLASDEAEAHRTADYENQNAELSRDASVAEMTAPRLVQSGSSGYNTQAVEKGPGMGSSIAQGAASVGTALIL